MCVTVFFQDAFLQSSCLFGMIELFLLLRNMNFLSRKFPAGFGIPFVDKCSHFVVAK